MTCLTNSYGSKNEYKNLKSEKKNTNDKKFIFHYKVGDNNQQKAICIKRKKYAEMIHKMTLIPHCSKKRMNIKLSKFPPIINVTLIPLKIIYLNHF